MAGLVHSLTRVRVGRLLGELAGCGDGLVLLLGVLGDGVGPDSRAVGADLAPLADRAGVELHRDDGVATDGSCLFHHPGHRLVATVGEQAGELGDLAATERAEAGDAARADVARGTVSPNTSPRTAVMS